MDHRASIFSQKLDRVAFTSYFLGAIVPLVALGVVVERFVLPDVQDRLAEIGLIGAVASIAVLSLLSFLILRRTTRVSLEQIDRDNHSLEALLKVARSLSSAEHGADAADTAGRGALVLTNADASYVMVRGEPGAAPVRLSAVGAEAEKLEQRIVEPLVSIAKLVLSTGRPVLQGAEGAAPAMAGAPLPGEAMASGAIVVVRAEGNFDSRVLDPLATLAGLAAVALRNADLRDSQRNFFTHVTDMLVSALDAHLGYHAGHGGRVAQYANRLGRKMGLDDHQLQRLHFASLLHDVGMLKLERGISIDRRTAAKHTVLGGRMLARIRLWRDLAPIVEHHHEWWDGSGYPQGLSGNAIPQEARIISVCDAFDTITSATSYRDALPFEMAVREIESGAGTQFDPDVVGTFLGLVREGIIERTDGT